MESFEEMPRRIERIKANARELMCDDVRARHQSDSFTIEALREHGPIDPDRAEQAVFDVARLAVALAMASIYDEDGELKHARAERDRFRKLAHDSLMLKPMPIFVATAQ